MHRTTHNAKRLFLLACFCLMAIIRVPASACAEPAARIEETRQTYDTLQAAIHAAQDGQTVTLLRDVTENLVSGASYTLNLADHTVDGGQQGSVLTITGGTVVLRGGTLTGGYAQSSAGNQGGGAIFVSGSAEVTLESMTIEGNAAQTGGTLSGGGGVYLTDGSLTVTDSAFLNNTVQTTGTYSGGGAIYLSAGTVTVSGSIFDGNVASGNKSTDGGGAVYVSAGDVTVTETSFLNNQARGETTTSGYGGAFCLYQQSSLTVSDAVFDSNASTTTATSSSYGGGAIFDNNKSTVVTLRRSSFTNHFASYQAAVFYMNGAWILEDCNISGNACGTSARNSAIIYMTSANPRAFTRCRLTDNHDVMHTVYTASYTDFTFDGCLISGNTAANTGAVYAMGLTASSSTLTVADTVVTGNVATAAAKTAVGGLYVAESALAFPSGAIYHNVSGGNAKDLYITTKTNAVLAAKDMADDGMSFANYVWRKDDMSIIEESFVNRTDTPLLLTACDNRVRPVARYGGETFTSFSQAMKAASDDPARPETVVITLVAGEDSSDPADLYILNETVDIPFPVQLILNSRTLKASNYAEQGKLALRVKSGGSLILSGAGAIDGVIDLEDGGSIIAASDLSLSGKLRVNLSSAAVADLTRFSVGQDIVVPIVLGGEGRLRLFSAARSDAGPISPDCVVLENVTSRSVTIEARDGNIVAVNRGHEPGVFLSGSGSDANAGASSADPVQTFDHALALMRERGYQTIYLCGPVTVSGSQTWDGGGATLRRYVDSPAGDANRAIMIQVSGSLTLRNITVDGMSGEGGLYRNVGSILRVASAASLTLESGATLRGNVIRVSDVAYPGASPEAYAGGAVYVSGALTMRAGSVIEDCGALLGGGVYVDGGSFTMEGGELRRNAASGSLNMPGNQPCYGSGGGVCVTRTGLMTLSGGRLADNSASSFGGAISVGTGHYFVTSSRDVSLLVEAPADKRGVDPDWIELDGNRANSYGGAVFVQGGLASGGAYRAIIRDGYFHDNLCGFEEADGGLTGGGRFGGGAFYVNGDDGVMNGVLELSNVLITRNTAERSGGGIAGCGTSGTAINITDGSIIYGNTVGGVKDDLAISTDTQLDSFGPSRTRLIDHIASLMLDGTPYQWRHVSAHRFVPEDELDSSNGKHFYTDQTPALSEDDPRIRVRIVDNRAATRGGGIGSNGTIIIGGEYAQPGEFPVAKAWDGLDDGLQRPADLAELNLWVLGVSGGRVAYITYNALNNGGAWDTRALFNELPAGYDYYLVEEAVLGSRSIWSANAREIPGLDVQGEISRIMAVMHPGMDWVWSDESPYGSVLTSENGGFLFTNSPQFGSLTIAKTVEGEDADPAQAFTFTLTLLDATGAALPDSYPYTGSASGTIRSGESVSLRGGEQITVTGLPIGATYRVVEVEADMDDYYTTATGDTGTVTLAGATAAFINRRDPPPPPNNPTGSLTITKTVAGDLGESSRAFTFTMTLRDAAGAPLPDSYPYTGSASGMIRSGESVSLRGGEYVTIAELPMGAVYEVTEAEANAEGYVTTATDETGVVTLEGKTAAFTNTRNARPSASVNPSPTPSPKPQDPAAGSLTVSKTVTGDAGDKQKTFTFTVMLSDIGLNGSYGDMRFSGGVAQITLKHGESKTAVGLPADIRYSVVESEANQDGYATTARGNAGLIEAGVTSEALFVNARESAADTPDVPQTSDRGHTTLWIALMLLSAAGMLFIARNGIKR